MNILKINNKSVSEIFINYTVAIWFLVLITIGLIVGYSAGDDYLGYMANWERSLNENKPWQEKNIDGQVNSYGPFHPLMSFLFYFHPVLPKFIYMLIFTSANIWLFVLLKKNFFFNNTINIFLYFISIPFNFNIINYVYIFGHNDGLVVGLFVLSLITRIQKNYAISGLFLMISILEKYYTGFLYPIFIIDLILRKDFKNLKKFFYSSLLTFIAVLILNKVLYGSSLAFIYSFSNVDNILGFFSYINSIAWYFDLFKNRFGDTSQVLKLIIEYNLFSVIILYTVYLYFSVKLNINFYLNLLIAIMIVLTFHKSSFMTYYICTSCIVIFLSLNKKEKFLSKLIFIFFPYNVFLSIASFSYLFLSDAFGNIFPHARNIMGFVNLALSSMTIFFLLSTYFLNKKNL